MTNFSAFIYDGEGNGEGDGDGDGDGAVALALVILSNFSTLRQTQYAAKLPCCTMTCGT
jgi:hypothetical protein